MFRLSWNGFQEVSLSSSLASVADRIMVPLKCPCPNTWNMWICYLTLKMGLYRCVNLKILSCEIILKYLGGPNVVIKVLIRGMQEGQSEADVTVEVGRETGRCHTGCWLWRWRKEPQAKECRLPLEAGKGKEPCSPVASPGGMQPWWSVLNFWLPELL